MRITRAIRLELLIKSSSNFMITFHPSGLGGKFETLSELKEVYSQRLPLSVRKYRSTDTFTAFIYIVADFFKIFKKVLKTLKIILVIV